jgi:hypothetical protein
MGRRSRENATGAESTRDALSPGSSSAASGTSPSALPAPRARPAPQRPRQVELLTAAQNAHGRLEVFVVDRQTNGSLWRIVQTPGNHGWSSWHCLGGRLAPIGQLAIVLDAKGRLALFTRGSDGSLQHIQQRRPSSGWGHWYSLGGEIGRLAVGRNQDGRLEVFTRGADGALWHVWQTAPNNGWGEWHSLGGAIGPLAVGQNADGRLEVFTRGSDGALWHISQTAPNNGWGEWHSRTPWIQRSAEESRYSARFHIGWSDPEVDGTSCGPGSTLHHTESIRRALPHIIKGFDIRIVNDAGCGDFAWLRHVDLTGVDYLGYDLKEWPGNGGFPFQQLDIVNEPMRPCDLLICRDVLFHFPNEVIQKALRNFMRCARFLLATSMDHEKDGDRVVTVNNDHRHTWNDARSPGYSAVNLEAEPFNLPPPILTVPERTQSNRFLGLWDLSDLYRSGSTNKAG